MGWLCRALVSSEKRRRECPRGEYLRLSPRETGWGGIGQEESVLNKGSGDVLEENTYTGLPRSQGRVALQSIVN